jgi:glutamate--cysteine ligase
MDLDPFVPVGIKAQTLRFLDVFLLHCLLADSPDDTPQEIAELGRNQHRTAAFGRDPALLLERDGREVKLTDWGAEVLEQCMPIARQLDSVHATSDYSDALRAGQALLAAPDMLPSSRVLAAMARDHENGFGAFARAQSHQAKEKLLKLPYGGALHQRMEALARQSVQDQAAVEAADSLPFEQYRQQYVSPQRLGRGQDAVAPDLAAV